MTRVVIRRVFIMIGLPVGNLIVGLLIVGLLIVGLPMVRYLVALQ